MIPFIESDAMPRFETGTFDFSPDEFSLDDTLASGQCFRWKRRSDGWWIGVVGRRVLGVRQEGERFSWWAVAGGGSEELLRDYFQLDVDHAEIVRLIEEADPAAGAAARRWSGLRLLRQDPDECLLSFVCSTANQVPRIAYSIERLSAEYGERLAEVEGESYYTFPSVDALSQAGVAHLTKATSLGFRGANIVNVATQLVQRGPGWTASLRELPYREAYDELVALKGVGPKIADCVCLFALDKPEAVPVDTHVWQLARDLYFPGWASRKSMTGAAYKMVGDAFRERFGKLAGHAQNYLFYDHFCNHWGGTSPMLK